MVNAFQLLIAKDKIRSHFPLISGLVDNINSLLMSRGFRDGEPHLGDPTSDRHDYTPAISSR